MFPPDLLAILRCPETRQPLAVADAATLAAANARQQTAGAEALTEALVTADGRRAYPVRDGIPILLVEESIAL